MPSHEPSSSDSLPLGQVMYALQDTVLISQCRGTRTDRLQRVSFTGSVSEPQAKVGDPIDIGPLDDHRITRALIDLEGRQLLVMLTNGGLSVVEPHDAALHRAVLPTKTDDAVLVIGFDPVQTGKRRLALLVTAGAGFAVVQVDMEGGARGQPLQLPPHVRGQAVVAELVRRGASTMLVVATLEAGGLQVHVMNWKDLASQVAGERVTTLPLGQAVAPPSAQVTAVTTCMQAGSGDQQLALAWADTAGTCKLALLGWGDHGEAKIVATVAPDVRFAPPDRPVYRLAAADLLHAGHEQLVLGYNATYPASKLGWPARGGCAALMLFTLEASAGAAPNLACVSTYVVGIQELDIVPGMPGFFPEQRNVIQWPICDLHLGAGLFGTCLGVQIQALASNFGPGVVPQGEFSLPILCGFVPVDPLRRGFPAMPIDTVPPPLALTGDPQTDLFVRMIGQTQPVGTANMCGGPGVPGKPVTETAMPHYGSPPRFFAFSALNGQSVVLGPPRFTQKSGCAQILAIIQAPPFDRRVMTTAPSVNFSTFSGDTTGCTVSSDKSWTLSEDVSVNLGLGALNLSQATHNAYLKNFSNMKDVSSSTSVHFHSAFTQHDYLLVYETNYNVWSYPVKRASGTVAAGGELLVVFPEEATIKMSWIPAHTYGYRPKSEVGMLLSYVNLPREAYAEGNRLFKLFGITVAEKADISTVSFDQTNSTTNTDSRHFSVLNSTSTHLGVTASTELFEWLPASFGLNVGSSHSYADSSIDTTHVTVQSSLSLSVSSGTVKDPVYEYQMTPYIYHHARLGCLMLNWDVNLTGAAWRVGSPGADPAVTNPQICLIRPVSDSENLIYRAFSRSISFVEEPGGKTSIVVEIFNNSLSPILHVSCAFFLGKPELSKPEPGKVSVLVLPAQSLGKEELDGEFKPIERRTVTLRGQQLDKSAQICVQLFIGKIPQGIFWGTPTPGDLPEART